MVSISTGTGGVRPATARFAVYLHERIGDVQNGCHYLLVGIAAAVLLARLRAAAPRPRRHIGALLLMYLLFAAAQVFYYYEHLNHYWLSYSLFTAASALWSVALAHLVIRDESWRLDRTARRILAGLLLATVVTVVFVAAATALSLRLRPGPGAGPLLLIALVFALGAGMPRAAGWAVGLVDRLYYGDRAQPYQVLRTLAGRISQVLDPAELPHTLCGTVAEELRLPGVALTVCTRAGRRTLATVGAPDGYRQDFELLHHGAPIGQLTVGLRGGEQLLDERDTDILRSLADQAAPAIASLRLLEELQASREQIVATREEERRRLRRDIHDGLGPVLAGLRLRVDNAAVGLPPDTGLADTLRAVSGDLGMAIKEVRRITDRLGPAPLGEVGLSRALRQLCESFTGARLAVGAVLVPDRLPQLPAAVEVAVYRITAEALNNVLRHARARRATVSVRVGAQTLTLIVQDDGIGYRAPGRTPGTGASGVGLRSMADRAAEIGGHCTVGPLEHGTRVHAVLPRRPSYG
ncbi:ATP-binding protein [Kitasatospora sp. NPDC050543]|uniref:GAF domain-containing sensor histidine kinase n=1 Tax=Kitasatospora sp. NPDC050543 TaxID=3364054 RepID=UPI0037A86EC8